MNLRLILALSTLPLLSGCSSDFEFEEIEVQVRCVAPGTTAGILLVEKGIHGGRSEGAATEALQSILEGRRRFPPDGGFLSMDLDAEEEQSAPDSDSHLSDAGRRLVALGRGFRVEKTGLFQDEMGRLCLYQFWTLEDPRRVLAWLGEEMNKDLIQRADSKGPQSSGFPYLDDPSRSRALARARAGGSWVRLEEGGLVLDLPITRECAARCAADLLQNEVLRANFGPFVTQATSLEISDERTLLRYLPGSSGWLGPWHTEIKKDCDGRLHAWIKAGALPIGSPPDLGKLEEILRVRESLKNPPK